MVRSAYVYGLVQRAGQFGVSARDVSIDWSKVIDRKDRIVRQLEDVKQSTLEALGIEVLRERARFVSPHEVELNGRKVSAEKIILAVGSKVGRPPVEGLEMATTSDEALDLRDLPSTIVIIGGGVIAMEFAHVWNSVGVGITFLEMADRILSTEDEEISEAVAQLSLARGIGIHTGVRVQRVSKTDGGYEVIAQTPQGEQRFQAGLVMLAAGRVPNTEGLGLDQVGVQVQKQGIVTNEYLQTTVPHIYSGGDADGGYLLTPVASYEGRLAAKNALRGNAEKADYSLVAHTVFTIPPASGVGLTEDEARKQGIGLDVIRLPFSAIGRATIEDEQEGFVKILEEVDSGQIVGAHIFGARSDDLIHEFAIAMKGKLTRQELAEVIPIHPSLSEGVIAAAMSAETGRRESCCG